MSSRGRVRILSSGLNGGLYCPFQVRQLVVTNDSTFDGTVCVFKNAGTYYLAGSINVGETRVLDIRGRILSSQGADFTDSELLTFVSTTRHEGHYRAHGTAGDPEIALRGLDDLEFLDCGSYLDIFLPYAHNRLCMYARM
ncbi:hypothetical protein BDN71DRAFT_1510133 [Pleurotus eryngii]|uniref:Uncharacterized protein n=1 Tax=Pleurotus eryngii TaxID=5323 RepID=A0A9P5ZQG6_PLEER|nr:hypothetical protein BDN71DRAFT_1510133 [Pleurotus eryngii]